MAKIHDKLKRVRKPRVHITYEVETGGAEVERELPFVMGVLGDFSGNPSTPLKPLSERKFVQIDRDNFNQVMANITPELSFKAENTLAGDGSELSVELKFRSMDDFDPNRIVDQVEPLKKLMETRNKLNDLASKVDRSDELESVLEDVLKSTDKLDSLSSDLGLGGSGGGDAAEPAPESGPEDQPTEGA
jgi:type VI secretion system protein ImpB